MSRINTRSPYWVKISDTYLSYAILKIYVWNDTITSVPSTPTYTIRKSVLPSENVAGVTYSIDFEIAELVRDELDTIFDGNYNGQSVWTKVNINGYNSSGSIITLPINETTIAFDGYNYFEEQNADESALMITNRELFVLEDNTFRIPVYTDAEPTVVFYKDGEIIASEIIGTESESADQIKYISIYGDDANWDTFEERVLEDGGVDFENSVCLQSFFNNYSIGAVDKIEVSGSGQKIQTIKVNVLEECKYEPKKVTFINKFGALQDMYFFKKSVEMMNIEKESYKSNILNSSGGYSISSHVNRNFNVIGKESVTLSSGFLSEEYNEVFKQMMLSEKVWVTNIIETGEQVLPINVKTSDITYKTSLNNKLVEYTIEFDKSYNTINNIR
mgnify:FL=1|tara:strand:- start:6440 stop:7603 length:1164 start_codon:yes stop_codon:yes gene_type:complete